jgi:hypothetical protein
MAQFRVPSRGEIRFHAKREGGDDTLRDSVQDWCRAGFTTSTEAYRLSLEIGLEAQDREDPGFGPDRQTLDRRQAPGAGARWNRERLIPPMTRWGR